MDPREHWRSVYQSKRPDEVSWYQPAARQSLLAIDRVGATADASLVDIGAGASPLVDALLDRRWSDITLLDIAEPALEVTRMRLGDRAGRVRWEIADIRHWRPGRSFEVWHDRAVFHFLTEAADRALYRRALIEGTAPGAHVIIATFALCGPEQCSGLQVRRYDAAGIGAEFGADFRRTADWVEAHSTPRGATQHFQWVTLQRT